MTNTYKYAKRELDILVKNAAPDNRPVVEEFIPEILHLMEKFGNSGQSGGSGPYTATILARTIEVLLLQKPISPLYGTDDEWVDMSDMNVPAIKYQNNRNYEVFKDSEGQAWFIDGDTRVNIQFPFSI